MTTSLPSSRSRILVIVAVLALVAAAAFMPGFLFWSHDGLGPSPWKVFGPVGLMTVLNLALAIWVGIDAERRCGRGLLWGLLVLFTSVIGLIVYLLVCPAWEARSVSPARSGTSCPNCRGTTEPGFKICPYCGERLERDCPGCSRPVRREWRLCPQCGAQLD